MADDDTTETTQAADGDDDDGSGARTDGRREGVSVPSWLAASLVVLLGIAIGGAGFALGRATDGDDGGARGERPIVAVRPGQGGPGGQGNGPGFPGGPGGRGPGGQGELPFETGPRGQRPDRAEDGTGGGTTDDSEDEEPSPEDDGEGASLFGV